ncbi:hypothetical protein CEE45_07665 [Candidatus Heimdallarchaeota archaeon B3_Heim]|nr:MAG: hypothetical protein CEE45_07665 [Candidatus Heimdallarchaeota archaeon B3_Heim]
MVDSVKKFVRKSDIEKDSANFSEYSIILPKNWFDDIKEDEINSVKKKIRDTFDYRQKKVKSDNPNYFYLLKLFALGYRYPRIKQWLENLINEFRLNLHSKFEENISRQTLITPSPVIRKKVIVIFLCVKQR